MTGESNLESPTADQAEALIRKLRAYSEQLAPHARAREGGKLLVEAIETLAVAVEAVTELEALRKCCVQRGARLQILRELFRYTDWHAACDDRPEMRDWFDERGVPR